MEGGSGDVINANTVVVLGATHGVNLAAVGWMLIGTWMSASQWHVRGLQGGYGVAKGRKRVDVEGEVEVARPRGSRWLASVETGWPFRLGGFARGLESQPQGPGEQLNLSASR